MVVRQTDSHTCPSRMLQRGKWDYWDTILLIFHDFPVNICSEFILNLNRVSGTHVTRYEWWHFVTYMLHSALLILSSPLPFLLSAFSKSVVGYKVTELWDGTCFYADMVLAKQDKCCNLLLLPSVNFWPCVRRPFIFEWMNIWKGKLITF